MRQVTHALLTRPPLSHLSVRKLWGASFDLHVLSTPPAFILSQDQTLVKSVCSGSESLLAILFLFTVFGSTFRRSWIILLLRTGTHSKATLSRSWASPNPHWCELLKVNFQSSHCVRQFFAFRNFQECLFFVIYCLIINVLLPPFISCDSLFRLPQSFFNVNHFF